VIDTTKGGSEEPNLSGLALDTSIEGSIQTRLRSAPTVDALYVTLGGENAVAVIDGSFPATARPHPHRLVSQASVTVSADGTRLCRSKHEILIAGPNLEIPFRLSRHGYTRAVFAAFFALAESDLSQRVHSGFVKGWISHDSIPRRKQLSSYLSSLVDAKTASGNPSARSHDGVPPRPH